MTHKFERDAKEILSEFYFENVHDTFKRNALLCRGEVCFSMSLETGALKIEFVF